MRSEEEYDYCEEDESEEGPEEAPDAQLIREDVAGINDWLRRGTWAVLICAGFAAITCDNASPGKKLAAEKLNNSMWWVTEMRPIATKGKLPAVRITITDGQTGRIFLVPASHPYRHTGLFTWLYTPTDQNPDTDQVEDYLTPRYEEVTQ
jgi:hypothetical protein